MVKVKYPLPSYASGLDAKHYVQRSLPGTNNISGTHVSSGDPLSLHTAAKSKISSTPNPELRYKMPRMVIDRSEVDRYLAKPVQSVNSPMYKAVMTAMHRDIISKDREATLSPVEQVR